MRNSLVMARLCSRTIFDSYNWLDGLKLKSGSFCVTIRSRNITGKHQGRHLGVLYLKTTFYKKKIPFMTNFKSNLMGNSIKPLPQETVAGD